MQAVSFQVEVNLHWLHLLGAPHLQCLMVTGQSSNLVLERSPISILMNLRRRLIVCPPHFYLKSSTTWASTLDHHCAYHSADVSNSPLVEATHSHSFGEASHLTTTQFQLATRSTFTWILPVVAKSATEKVQSHQLLDYMLYSSKYLA